MRNNYKQQSFSNKVQDVLVSTALRHIARKVVYSADNYITYLSKDLEATSLRCLKCFKLCRYNFHNILYNCSHCRIRT